MECSFYAANPGLGDGDCSVLSFFERLYSISIRHGEGDKLVWNPSKRGLFEVRSIMKCLLGKMALHFCGRVSGLLKLRQWWLSLYGQQL